MELPTNIKEDFLKFAEEVYRDFREVNVDNLSFTNYAKSPEFKTIFAKHFEDDFIESFSNYRPYDDLRFPGLCFIFNVVLRRHGVLTKYVPTARGILQDLGTGYYILQYFPEMQTHVLELGGGNDEDDFWFPMSNDGIEKRYQLIKKYRKDGKV